MKRVLMYFLWLAALFVGNLLGRLMVDSYFHVVCRVVR